MQSEPTSATVAAAVAAAATAKPSTSPSPSPLRVRLQQAVESGNGCILASEPAIVHRGTYAGRNIIGPNSTYSAQNVDDRGYVPVEWWVMSKTVALNPICRENEGVTLLAVEGGDAVRFNEAVEAAGDVLLGDFASRWPLTKVLDIGGAPVQPRFIPGDDAAVSASLLKSNSGSDQDRSTGSKSGDGEVLESHAELGSELAEAEYPPIPCHVHCGDYGGNGSGKLEAYFFPPLDVPPYNLKVGNVKTRLGLKPSTTKEEVVAAMKRFGVDDSMYQLLNVFPVKARETWTIPTHVIHAPGPWTTFEIQLPQDDFNLFAWQLGQKITDESERRKVKQDNQLRGYKTEEDLLQASLKWPLNVDPEFETRWRHDCEILEEGDFGRRLRLFYHEFYGEGFEIAPGQTLTRAATNMPYAGITWSGCGTLNDVHKLDMAVSSRREFLVTPDTEVVVKNTGTIPLLIYCVFPFDLSANLSTSEIGRLVQGKAGHGAGCGC